MAADNKDFGQRLFESNMFGTQARFRNRTMELLEKSEEELLAGVSN